MGQLGLKCFTWLLFRLTIKVILTTCNCISEQGHVLWDTAMPANLGYISAMSFNQNNCASEVSTVTSKFEIEVGKDLCVMLGYDRDKCMGHLTAGGTVANIEAIWAGRNIKYFPLGLQEALQKDDRLLEARGYKASFIFILK